MEALETKTIECQECLGTGKIEKLICTKPVSECCGGCYTYKECYNCGGEGEIEVEIKECDNQFCENGKVDLGYNSFLNCQVCEELEEKTFKNPLIFVKK